MRAIGYRKASPELDHLEAFDIPRPKPHGRDLLVAVLYNKDIMKEHRGQAIDDQGEEDRLGPGIEPVMSDEMEIEGLEQEKPAAGA